MSLVERVAKVSDRFYDRVRSAKAVDVAEAEPTGSLDDLRGKKYCVLVSYRKSGEPMPSALWFGTGNGKLYFQSGADAGKVKRIRSNPEVRVAAATSRGRPTSAPFTGRARVLDVDEAAEAERCIKANYGIGRKIYMRVGDAVPVVYVEVTPSQR